eukprot:3781546-Amphidinium_carterae.1
MRIRVSWVAVAFACLMLLCDLKLVIDTNQFRATSGHWLDKSRRVCTSWVPKRRNRVLQGQAIFVYLREPWHIPGRTDILQQLKVATNQVETHWHSRVGGLLTFVFASCAVLNTFHLLPLSTLNRNAEDDHEPATVM